MNDTLNALLQAGALQQTSYGPESRYFGIPPLAHDDGSGRAIRYTGRRFIPMPERFRLIAVHRVVAGERVDNLAAQLVGDPLLYWRLCDANVATRPADLEAPGLALRVPAAALGNGQTP